MLGEQAFCRRVRTFVVQMVACQCLCRYTTTVNAHRWEALSCPSSEFCGEISTRVECDARADLRYHASGKAGPLWALALSSTVGCQWLTPLE